MKLLLLHLTQKERAIILKLSPFCHYPQVKRYREINTSAEKLTFLDENDSEACLANAYVQDFVFEECLDGRPLSKRK